MTLFRAASTLSGSSFTFFRCSSFVRSSSISLPTVYRLGPLSSAAEEAASAIFSCANLRASDCCFSSLLSSSATRAWMCISSSLAREASVWKGKTGACQSLHDSSQPWDGQIIELKSQCIFIEEGVRTSGLVWRVSRTGRETLGGPELFCQYQKFASLAGRIPTFCCAVYRNVGALTGMTYIFHVWPWGLDSWAPMATAQWRCGRDGLGWS